MVRAPRWRQAVADHRPPRHAGHLLELLRVVERAALAQSRYQNNNVIQPTTMTASGYAATGGAGANNAGNAMAPPAPAAGP